VQGTETISSCPHVGCSISGEMAYNKTGLSAIPEASIKVSIPIRY
jgi:hypothetical protein